MYFLVLVKLNAFTLTPSPHPVLMNIGVDYLFRYSKSIHIFQDIPSSLDIYSLRYRDLDTCVVSEETIRNRIGPQGVFTAMHINLIEHIKANILI